MPLLDAQALAKSFGPQVVLGSVSVAIDDGERVGLVGDNGCGKSTLGRILAGVLPADSGAVHMRRGARVSYLGQNPELDPAHSGVDAVLSGLHDWWQARARHEAASASIAAGGSAAATAVEEQARAASELDRLGGFEQVHRAEAMLSQLGLRDPSRPVAEMSGGEQRRVALARTLLADAELCVLDEPTNHLDVDTIEWLERYLGDPLRGALLLITHDRYLLDRVAARTLELHHGTLYDYQGGYQRYLEAKAERLSHEARAEQNRQNLLRREIEWLRRQPKARSTKQKARVERAEALQAKAAPKAETGPELELVAARSGKTVLELHKVRIERAGRELARDIDLHVRAGERIGIVGPNGAGKTSLLLCIIGQLQPAGGEIVVGANTKTAYLSQSREGLDPEQSVFDNVAEGRMRVSFGGVELDVRSYLQRFLFSPEKQRQPVSSLSGGERTRVALAKLLFRAANLVVLDEPTNDLDIRTLGAVEDMLGEFSGSALVVTHDRYFLDRIATAILAHEQPGQEQGGHATFRRYEGDYSRYLATRKAAATADRISAPTSARSKRDRDRDRGKASSSKLTYAERLELEELPEAIDLADAEVSRLEAELSDPELYRRKGDQVAERTTALEQARQHAASLLARWEQLELKREASQS